MSQNLFAVLNMSAVPWAFIVLGLIVIFVSILCIAIDCQKTQPLMGKNKSQCSGFYSILMLTGILFAVIGGLLFKVLRPMY